MRFVVAPQEFKGSLTADQAAAAIAAGIRAACPDAQIDEAPMSDGGTGLVDALLAARPGARVTTQVHDPLMRPVRASWARLDDGTGAIEMAAASGLVLLAPEERDPLIATTYGTGELISAALDAGCPRIVVGAGGSATVDAGAGALQALGVRLLDARGEDLPTGGAALIELDRIDVTAGDERVAGADIVVATDVTNPLCGPEGAAAVFGPQKGASPDGVRALGAALERFAHVASRDLRIDVLGLPGGGAAGGLAAGLAAGAGASIASGFDIVAEAARLEERIAAADIVITGEGRLDAQTAYGKTAAGVARLARRHGKRVIAIAGGIDPSFDRAPGAFDDAVSLLRPGLTVDEAVRDAKGLLGEAAAEVARRHCGAAGA